MRLEVLNYGATIVSLKVPDKHGKLVDVVLAYTDTEGASFIPKPAAGDTATRVLYRDVTYEHSMHQIPFTF